MSFYVWLMLFLAFWIFPILVAWYLGARKGRTYGWLYGLVGSWIGVIVIALLPARAVTGSGGGIGLSTDLVLYIIRRALWASSS